MMKGFLIALLVTLALVSGQATAQFSYDSRSGNTYNTIGGSTYGYNPNTGSTWQNHNLGNRSYGIDSRGNSWTHDRSTGFYQNQGTGKTCFGTGALRQCY